MHKYPTKKLSEISSILNGYAFKSGKYTTSGIRIIRIANVQDGYIVDEAPCFYPIDSSKDIKTYFLYENDLLVSLTGNVGRIGILNKSMLPAALNQRVACVRPNANVISAKYLFYYLFQKSFQTSCIKAAKGMAQLNLSSKWLSEYKLPVPPLPEQERIVAKIEELFSQLDAAVAELKSVKEKLAIYRQAVLKEAFEGKLTEKWRANNPDANAEGIMNKIFQRKAKQARNKTYSLQEDINLCDLPDEWKWIFIGDITDAPEYGTSQKSLATGKVPVIRMGNLQKGIIDWSDLAFTNDENDINKYRLRQGDVLFNRTNSPELVGKTSIFQGERDAIFAGYLIRINHYEFINSRYLNHYMNSFVAKNYGNKVKTDGVNQSNINGQKMCSYPFPLCSEKEQEQVVYELEERLSTFDSIEQTVDTALQQAAALRQSILKQAFEGDF